MKPVDCIYCQDEGIVELVGTTTDRYSRGSAPCRWCEAGRKLRARLTTQKQHPLTDYSATSLAIPPLQTRYRTVTKEEALAEWETCDHSWQQLGEAQPRPWAKDILQWRRCTRCGKEEAATQKLAPTKETP